MTRVITRSDLYRDLHANIAKSGCKGYFITGILMHLNNMPVSLDACDTIETLCSMSKTELHR